MLKITELPKQYIEKYGKERVAEVIGQKPSVLSMWLSRDSWPLEAIEKLLAFDPYPINDIKPLYQNTPIGGKLAICVPCNAPINGRSLESMMRLYNPVEMQPIRRSFNNPVIVRNCIAQIFLDSGCEWAFWHDSDMILPAGDSKWFKEATGITEIPDVFTGVNSIMRMLHHRKKLIGCLYFAKRHNGEAQFSGGHDMMLANSLRYRPRDEISPRDWVGFGGVLMHRDVLLDIIKTQGDEIKVRDEGITRRFGYKYSFFERLPEWTEDTSFCIRAKKAGHQPYVDFSVRAAHIGDSSY